MRLKQKSKQSDRTYEIMVSQRETVGRYATDSAAEYTLYSDWITPDRINQLIDMIKSSDRIWFSIYYTIRPAEAAEVGKNIADSIIEVIDDLWDLYKYIIKP